MILTCVNGRRYASLACNDVPRYQKGEIVPVGIVAEHRFGGFSAVFRHKMTINGLEVERLFAERYDAADRPLWREVKEIVANG